MRSTEPSMNTSKPTTAIEHKVADIERKFNENSFAYEMLKEQKKTIKRLFTTVFVLIAFIFVMICSFLGAALYVYNNYDFEAIDSVEYVQDGSGNNIIGNSNEVSQ